MPPRRSNRARRNSGSETTTWVLFSLVILAIFLVGSGFAWLYMRASARVVLDNQTLCPLDGPRSVSVVLLDTSDQWPEVTREQVRKRLEKRARDIPDFGLLELRLLDPKTPGGRITFTKCNPGDGSNLSELDDRPDLAYKKWLEQFDRPFKLALDHGLKQSKVDSSPILATAQRIAVDRFDGSVVTTFTVVSDMIEHTADYSQYRGSLSYEQYKQTPAYKKQHTDLKGAAVTILYVQRVRMSSGKHIQFWLDWISDNNGGRGEAEKLQGAD